MPRDCPEVHSNWQFRAAPNWNRWDSLILIVLIMSYDNSNKTNKRVRRIPNIKEILQTFFCIFVVVGITYWIESTCLKTLMPICIPWMYYQFVLLIIFIVLEVFRDYYNKPKKPRRKRKNRRVLPYTFSVKCIAAIIIIPALFFLPNRYVKVETELEYDGCVVDQTKWKLSKTASWNNYVKIKIDDSNTSFWCNLGKEAWPIGTKCIISTSKGIFGMRYVEDVRFLIE